MKITSKDSVMMRVRDVILTIGKILIGSRYLPHISLRDYLWFVQILAVIRKVSMLSMERKFSLYFLSRVIYDENISGDFVEAGVFKGGSSALLAGIIKNLKLTGRELHLFDSFEGFPEPCDVDGMRAQGKQGDLRSEVEEVMALVQEACGTPYNVKIYKGWFKDTFPTFDFKPIALLHVDCDFYESVKLTLDTFYPHISPGGIIIVDDYGSFEGCRVAIHEFLASHEPTAKLIQVDDEGYYFRKPKSQDNK